MYEFFPEKQKGFFERHTINFFLIALNVIAFIVIGILFSNTKGQSLKINTGIPCTIVCLVNNLNSVLNV
jgi:hypothetical protein